MKQIMKKVLKYTLAVALAVGVYALVSTASAAAISGQGVQIHAYATGTGQLAEVIFDTGTDIYRHISGAYDPGDDPFPGGLMPKTFSWTDPNPSVQGSAELRGTELIVTDLTMTTNNGNASATALLSTDMLKARYIQLTRNGEDYAELAFSPGKLVSGLGYDITVRNPLDSLSPANRGIIANVDAFHFDLTGAVNNSVLLSLLGADGHGEILFNNKITESNMVLEGTVGNLSAGARIILVQNYQATSGLPDFVKTCGGYTFTISYDAGAKELIATVTGVPIIPPSAHLITVNYNAEHGTVTSSVPYAILGEEVTLTATPKTGYKLKEWTVISGGITITDNKFTMPDNDVEVTAVFEKIPDAVPQTGVEDYIIPAAIIATLALAGAIFLIVRLRKKA